MKIAICFFGLNRSLSITHKSIEDNIFKPLDSIGAEYNIFTALMNPKSGYSNLRSGELRLLPEQDSLKFLNSDELLLLDQDNFDQNINFNLPPEIDAYGDQHHSTMNIFRELFSINQAYELACTSGDKFDAFVFLRPDLFYHDRFNFEKYISLIKNNGPATLLTPAWQKWQGLNDRFAIAGNVAAIAYGARLFFIDTFLNETKLKLHAEIMLLYLAHKNSLNIAYDLTEKASRVRGNGVIKDENFQI
jgi:hypothetical protein